MKRLAVAVIGCRFNHHLGDRVLCMWRYLAKKYNIDVHILTTDRWIDKPGDSKLKDSKNLKIHKLTTLGAKYGQFKHTMPGLVWHLFKLNPDIVYSQEEPIQMGITWPAYLTAKILKKPFVFYTLENLLTKWFEPIKSVENQIIKGSDLMLAITKESRDVLIKKGADPNKVKVIVETGVDTDKFKPVKNKVENSILYIGRLVPEKGINVLLKARELLIKRNFRYKYIFVGEGPLKNKLMKLSEKNEDIFLLKPTPYPDVSKLYRLGTIFFYASLRTPKWEEQYGYSMIEAMSCGLPVISTKGISGPEAIVEERPLSLSVRWGQRQTRKIGCGNGFLIHEGDHKELAKYIEILMEDKDLLKQMSKNARKDALTKFSKEVVAKETYELLKKVRYGN